jgi:hypothetical protein
MSWLQETEPKMMALAKKKELGLYTAVIWDNIGFRYRQIQVLRQASRSVGFILRPGFPTSPILLVTPMGKSLFSNSFSKNPNWCSSTRPGHISNPDSIAVALIGQAWVVCFSLEVEAAPLDLYGLRRVVLIQGAVLR